MAARDGGAAASLPTVKVRADARSAVDRGHPWIWDRAVVSMAGARAGQLVRVCDPGGALGIGYADPDSPLAVRMLCGAAEAEAIGAAGSAEAWAAWARGRAREAGAVRRALPQLASVTGFRAIHGEGDHMPGLIVDIYADTAVAVFDGAAAAALWRPWIGAVVAGLSDAGVAVARVWERRQRRQERHERAAGGQGQGAVGGAGAVLVGDAPPEVVDIDEGGARFGVDVRRGQKTGFFLDQRDNRRLVRDLSAGADVLNLFSYTGGFSVQAALGGARHTTSVDLAAPAIAAARDNFARNGLDPGDHAFAAEDVLAFLTRERGRGRRWDVVIADPPSYAPSQRARGRALATYRKLNEAALDVVAAGGLLVTASCSSHVSDVDLLAVVADACAARGRRGRVVDVRGAGPDHPVRPGFPEGRYLALAVVAVV